MPDQTLLSLGATLALAALAVVVAYVAARYVSRRVGMVGAGPLALLAATPILPHATILGGLSFDDLLPLVGVAMLLLERETWVMLRRLPYSRVMAVGLILVVGAATASSLAHASDLSSFVGMLLRSAGRFSFLAIIAMTSATALPAARRRTVVAIGLALMGTAEAAFGLVSFLVPLPYGFGLEFTRTHSVLYLKVPGRITGTLSISPDFLGALFLFTIPMTIGLAIDAPDRRSKAAWWAAALVQVLALALTFTRASLGLFLVLVVVLIAFRSRLVYLVPVAAIIGLVAALTPTLSRLTGDIPDRLALWSSAIRLMEDFPLLGAGPGRMLTVAATDPQRYSYTAFGFAGNSAHNTVLLAGAEFGVAGAVGVLLLNVGLALVALRLLWAAQMRTRLVTSVEVAAALAMLAFLAQGMVNNLFTVAVTGTVAALVYGAVLLPEPVGESVPAGGQRPAGESVRSAAVPGHPLE